VRPAAEKIVALPNRAAEAAAPAEATEVSPERWKGIAEPGSTITSGLDAVAAADANFDAKHFLTGARAALEMIVNAYAEGDRRTLKNLLARRVMTVLRMPSAA
jgi:predicted lipid-binding transport protein (Tim44 family)